MEKTFGLGNSRNFLISDSSFSSKKNFLDFTGFHELFLNANKPNVFSALGVFGTLVLIIHATFY